MTDKIIVYEYFYIYIYIYDKCVIHLRHAFIINFEKEEIYIYAVELA